MRAGHPLVRSHLDGPAWLLTGSGAVVSGSQSFERQACLLPSGKTTQESLGAAIAARDQGLCHTGTLVFLASGAVEDDVLITGQLIQAAQYFCFGDRDRSRGVRAVVGGFTAHVHQ